MADHLTELWSCEWFWRNSKPFEITALTLHHNRRASTAVLFHDEVDSLFCSSYVLGFLVKQEFVSTSSLAILTSRSVWGSWLSKDNLVSTTIEEDGNVSFSAS